MVAFAPTLCAQKGATELRQVAIANKPTTYYDYDIVLYSSSSSSSSSEFSTICRDELETRNALIQVFDIDVLGSCRRHYQQFHLCCVQLCHIALEMSWG